MIPVARKIARTSKATAAPGVVRVAAYARVSVEDTHSEFSSTEAQFDAIEAYVASQAANRWVLVPERFEDDGYSGKNVARPAFAALTKLVRAGGVDIIAVAKLDRVSRSVADFVRLEEEFSKHGTTFLSTSQQFSTATSSGRLVMNLLIMFAQFEREQISERTRAKMHAARRRGLWTGGPIPLGYDLVDSKLLVNPAEAERVRAIYELFLARESLTDTLAVLRERDWRTKTWTTKDATLVEARPFDKGSLRNLLLDPVPRGRVRLGDETYPGQHERIVDEDLATAVETALTRPRATQITSGNKRGVVLRGMVLCAVCGTTMRVGCGGRGKPYFICGRAVEAGARACPGSRVSVPVLEQGVLDRVRSIGRDPAVVDATLAAVCAERESQIAAATARAKALDAERGRVERERGRLIDAIAQGGSASLTERIAAMDAEVADLQSRSADASAEVARLRATTIDPDELRALLADFDPLWSALFQTERERLLRLLIHAIRFDGRTGTVTIEFHGGGEQ